MGFCEFYLGRETHMTDETRRASEIPPEVLDQLLAGYSKPEDLTADDGLFRRLKKALIGCTLR